MHLDSLPIFAVDVLITWYKIQVPVYAAMSVSRRMWPANLSIIIGLMYS